MWATRLSAASLYHLRSHVVGLPALRGVAFQKIREEKDLQHSKDDYQFYYNDGPQRPPYCHLAEAVGVKVIHPTQDIAVAAHIGQSCR